MGPGGWRAARRIPRGMGLAMSVGFSKKPKAADKDPKRRPQTVTVADASGVRTMSLDEYRASDRGIAAADRALNSGEIGGRHPDIVFGALAGRAPTEQEQAYRANYNAANLGMPEVRPQDALKNVGAMIAIAAGGAAASGWAPGAAGAAPAAAPVSTGTLAGSGASAATGGLTTNAGLGVFANSGAAGMGAVGGGNAGLLAAGGGITGGAGTGMLGSLGGNGLLSQNSIKNSTRLNGLMGGDDQAAPQMLAQQQPVQRQSQGMFGSPPVGKPILPGMPQGLIQGFGRKPYQFYGQTIWM